MKILGKMTMALTALALCAACSDEDDVLSGSGTSGSNLTATIPAYQFDDGTRVNISDDLQTFTWSDNDMLGIYYSDASTDAQTGYTVKQGGSSSGEFANDVFYLNPNKNYYAFYPYSSSFTTTSAEVDFTGQKQGANGSAAHLGAYNYMYTPVTVESSGSAKVNFKNLGSVMQLQLTASNAATFTSIDIVSDNIKFITKGKASMIDGSITATEVSDSIRLPFEHGIALEAGDVLTANLLTAPVDMSSSNLTITVKDVESNDYVVTTTGKDMLQGKAYLYEEVLPFVDVNDIPYVTFKADGAQTFRMDVGVNSLEYSVNNGSWTLLGTDTIAFGGENGDLRLRGKSSTGTGSSNIIFGSKNKVACSGDIRTLIDYENYDTTDTQYAIFNKLFYHCTSLTSAPDLPAMNLAGGCYKQMFYECESLTKAPELPATTLSGYCYNEMFKRCFNLTQPPVLPATVLAPHCYKSMFWECNSLTQAPDLPATQLTQSCYYEMFRECYHLVKAPVLPATTLASHCYSGMFRGCKSLTQAPELPATTLAYKCYYYMFTDCDAMTTAPALPATTMEESCYELMFYQCDKLVYAPELPATNLAKSCYGGMFQETAIVSAPALPATTLKESCYSGIFSRCSKLTKAPELPATTLTESCYNNMFYNCSSLAIAPALPATTMAYLCYNQMFSGCTSLTQAPELPATTLASKCYYEMFLNCKSLIQAPVLPATTLASSCYSRMFNGCSKLNYIKMMATDISASSCLSNWVSGVATSGTFLKDPSMTSLPTGNSGIPDGWTVVDYTDSTGPDMSGSDMGGDW